MVSIKLKAIGELQPNGTREVRLRLGLGGLEGGWCKQWTGGWQGRGTWACRSCWPCVPSSFSQHASTLTPPHTGIL